MLRPPFTARSLVAVFFTVLTVCPLAMGAANPHSKTQKKEPSAASAAATSASSSKPQASQPLLPEVFAGWELTGKPQLSSQPEVADVSDANVLREYGFSRFELANYTRGESKLTVKAMEFDDATGAFGDFTFYRTPNMAPEKIGQGAAFDGTRVLFWQGTVLVDAKFTRLTPMSISELRDLAGQLPKPVGNQGTLPTLPGYLPPKGLNPVTVQYAIGPRAYQRSGYLSGPALPAALIDFNRSAEVVTAQYSVMNGTLTIINYPTPDIAIDRLHAIRSYFAGQGMASQAAAEAPPTANAGPYPRTTALAASNPGALLVRRSGPLVIVTSGGFSTQDAEQMVQRVHYEAYLTLSNGTVARSDSSKVAQIILDVAVMVGIFALIAIVAGISLGGGRIAWRKMRDKSGKPEEESAEFIRLNLKD